MMKETTAGLMSPERVPMTSPDSGVNPIDVSMTVSATAQRLIRAENTVTFSVLRLSCRRAAVRRATYQDVPWKP